MLQSEIDIFDLDTTTVHAGCSKTPPSEKSQCQLFASLQTKKEVHGRAYTIALPLYTSDIEITLIVLIRIEIIDASYTLL